MVDCVFAGGDSENFAQDFHKPQPSSQEDRPPYPSGWYQYTQEHLATVIAVKGCTVTFIGLLLLEFSGFTFLLLQVL